MGNNEGKKPMDKKMLAGITVLVLIVIAVIVIVLCKVFGGSGNTDVNPGVPVDYDAEGYISLGEYIGVPVSVEVTDEDVQEEIDYILEDGYEAYEKLEGTAASGDMANISYEAYLNGEPVEDEAMEDTYINIGEDEYFTEFDTEIVGMKTGESKDIDVAIPEDYGYDIIDGKTVKYVVTLNYICGEAITPELNDEFVTEYSEGECTSLDDFNDYIRAELYDSNVSSIADDVWTQITENTRVEKYHKGELDKAIQETRQSYESFAEFAGYESVEEFRADYEMTDDDIEDVAKDMALDKMVAKTIAVKEHLSVDDATYRDLLINYMEYENTEDDIAAIEAEYRDSYCEEPRDGMLLEYVKQYVADKAAVTGMN